MKIRLVDAALKDSGYNFLLIPFIKIILRTPFSKADSEVVYIEQSKESEKYTFHRELMQIIQGYKKEGYTQDQVFKEVDLHLTKYKINVPYLRKLILEEFDRQ